MPRATFIWLLDSDIQFNRFLLLQLNERLAQFIGMVEHDRLLGPDARVGRGLAALFNPYLYPGLGLQLQISQEEIGYLAGPSRGAVSPTGQSIAEDIGKSGSAAGGLLWHHRSRPGRAAQLYQLKRYAAIRGVITPSAIPIAPAHCNSRMSAGPSSASGMPTKRRFRSL